jgi:hypothetical protein
MHATCNPGRSRTEHGLAVLSFIDEDAVLGRPAQNKRAWEIKQPPIENTLSPASFT